MPKTDQELEYMRSRERYYGLSNDFINTYCAMRFGGVAYNVKLQIAYNCSDGIFYRSDRVDAVY